MIRSYQHYWLFGVASISIPIVLAVMTKMWMNLQLRLRVYHELGLSRVQWMFWCGASPSNLVGSIECHSWFFASGERIPLSGIVKIVVVVCYVDVSTWATLTITYADTALTLEWRVWYHVSKRMLPQRLCQYPGDRIILLCFLEAGPWTDNNYVVM